MNYLVHSILGHLHFIIDSLNLLVAFALMGQLQLRSQTYSEVMDLH